MIGIPRAIVVLAALAVLPASLHGQDPRAVACEKCHANAAFLAAMAPGRQAALYVPDSLVRGTRHQRLPCAACHPGYDRGYPHRAAATSLPCQSCHPAAGRDWAASVHATNVEGDAAGCVACHGAHTVYGVGDRRSPTHPLNVAELCARCHMDERIIGTYFASTEKAQARTAVPQYYQTVHGTALTKAGLAVSATCNDCHGAHLILPADSAASSVHRTHIAATCGACHVGILEVYDGSVHAEVSRRTGTAPDAAPSPVCTDCHSAHGIVRASESAWFLGVVEECGTCHAHLYDTYFETYHGKVTRLGFGLTAKCSDCHTAHDIRRASDPKSSVFPANLVATCRQCHASANQNFVRYYAHGDPRDRQRYPRLFWPWLAMTGLLAGVFTFFGAHTLLWLTRLAIDRIRGRTAPPAAAPSGRPAHQDPP